MNPRRNLHQLCLECLDRVGAIRSHRDEFSFTIDILHSRGDNHVKRTHGLALFNGDELFFLTAVVPVGDAKNSHAIADVKPSRIVQIHEQKRQGLIVALGPRDAGTQSVHEQPPVREIRETVVLGTVHQLLLRCLLHRNILRVAEQLRHLAVFIEKRNEARAEHPCAAVDNAGVFELAYAPLAGLSQQVRDALLIPGCHNVHIRPSNDLFGIHVPGLTRALGVDAEETACPVDFVNAYRRAVHKRSQTKLIAAQHVLRPAPFQLRRNTAGECTHE